MSPRDGNQTDRELQVESKNTEYKTCPPVIRLIRMNGIQLDESFTWLCICALVTDEDVRAFFRQQPSVFGWKPTPSFYLRKPTPFYLHAARRETARGTAARGTAARGTTGRGTTVRRETATQRLAKTLDTPITTVRLTRQMSRRTKTKHRRKQYVPIASAWI